MLACGRKLLDFSTPTHLEFQRGVEIRLSTRELRLKLSDHPPSIYM